MLNTLNYSTRMDVYSTNKLRESVFKLCKQHLYVLSSFEYIVYNSLIISEKLCISIPQSILKC